MYITPENLFSLSLSFLTTNDGKGMLATNLSISILRVLLVSFDCACLVNACVYRHVRMDALRTHYLFIQSLRFHYVFTRDGNMAAIPGFSPQNINCDVVIRSSLATNTAHLYL